MEVLYSHIRHTLSLLLILIVVTSQKLYQSDKEPTYSLRIPLIFARRASTRPDIDLFMQDIADNPTEVIEIAHETQEWAPNMDIVTPINESSIPGFRQWVAWNGSASHFLRGELSAAFDWAAYLRESEENEDGEIVLGLSSDTDVRAIADGQVLQVPDVDLTGEYGRFISIEHGKQGSGLCSLYEHVVPLVKEGQEVKKGDKIARLYKDPGDEEGRLVHLHFRMVNSWGVENRSLVDPEMIYNKIKFLHATAQRALDFKIAELEGSLPLVIANFRKVRIGEDRIDKYLGELIGRRDGDVIRRRQMVLDNPYLGLDEEQLRRLHSAL